MSYVFMRSTQQSYLKKYIIDLLVCQFAFSAFHTACTALPSSRSESVHAVMFILTNIFRLAMRAAGLACAWLVFLMTGDRRYTASVWYAEVANTHGASCHRLVRVLTVVYSLCFTLPFVLVGMEDDWLEEDYECWYDSNVQVAVELGSQLLVFLATAVSTARWWRWCVVWKGEGRNQA